MTVSSVNVAGLVADPAQLAELRQSAIRSPQDAVREAARQFESLFTRMMLKTLREASLGESLGDSEETHFYQDLYDQQLALQLSQGDGLGLAKRLTEQLLRSQLAGASHGASAGASDGASASASDGASSAKAISDSAKREFAARIAPYAESAAARLGVNAETLIAHAALETGWGRHLPGAAAGSHNLFGIKAGANWSGESARALTTEFAAGRASQLSQNFRSYPSHAASLEDYVALIGNSPRYRAALGSGADAQRYATALVRGGYATDPDYVQKLAALAEQVWQLRQSSGSSATEVASISAAHHG